MKRHVPSWFFAIVGVLFTLPARAGDPGADGILKAPAILILDETGLLSELPATLWDEGPIVATSDAGTFNRLKAELPLERSVGTIRILPCESEPADYGVETRERTSAASQNCLSDEEWREGVPLAATIRIYDEATLESWRGIDPSSLLTKVGSDVDVPPITHAVLDIHVIFRRQDELMESATYRLSKHDRVLTRIGYERRPAMAEDYLGVVGGMPLEHTENGDADLAPRGVFSRSILSVLL